MCCKFRALLLEVPLAFYLSKKKNYCVDQSINTSIHILLPTLLLTSIRKIFQNLALTSLYILKSVDEIIHSTLRFPSDMVIKLLTRHAKILIAELVTWNVRFISTSLLQEIVERILLAIVPQSCFELWRNLTSEAVVQELHHTSVEMLLHTS